MKTEKPKYAPGAKDIELSGDRIVDVLVATAENLSGRCKCGRVQPDDVFWSRYEVEVENVIDGDTQTSQLVLCPDCEAALDESGVF